MQVSVEKTDNKLERKLRIQVPADRVEGEVTGRLKHLGKRAKLKGFRPGKVPFKVLEQQFGPQVRQEVLSDLIRESYAEALQREQLKPAGAPRIDDTRSEPGAAFEYTATIEVYPEVELKPLDQITVERPESEVTEADIDGMVEKLRAQRATWHDVERASADGDRLMVDFEGRLGDEVFDGGKGEDVEVVLGSGRFLPGFESKLEGAMAGDVREFNLDFPDDYPNKDLAGKTAAFTVTVKAVAERQLPAVDDAFFAIFGVDDLDALRAGIRANMERELGEVIHKQVKEQVLDQLVANHPDIDLPQGLVSSEIDRMRGEAMERMGAAQAKQAPALPDELFEQMARKRVAMGLLLGEIVRKESVQLDRQRVKHKIDEIAGGFDEPQRVIETYAQNPRLMDGVEAMVMEDQVVDLIVERAQVTPKPMEFDEIMNPKRED